MKVDYISHELRIAPGHCTTQQTFSSSVNRENMLLCQLNLFDFGTIRILDYLNCLHFDMTHCCSQCSFTAQFESALMMHHQLHHESSTLNGYLDNGAKTFTEKANTLPMTPKLDTSFSGCNDKGLGRTSSATRLFERLRSRISKTRSKMLFSHPEEANETIVKDLNSTSECTSKAMNVSPVLKSSIYTKSLGEVSKETFACHLCPFDADRITVLDRHLLNHHKIGLEKLLKLVMAKTKDGLSDDCHKANIYGIREPYYKPTDEIIEEGEFVVETITPKIKILKHSSTNTELQWTDIPDLKDNCKKITKELEKLIKYPVDKFDKEELLNKMQTLSDCMCKFVDSANTLKKILTKEFDSKTSVRERLSTAEPFFDLGLSSDTPREWDRAHSDKMERARHSYGDGSRGGKSKLSSESFYY